MGWFVVGEIVVIVSRSSIALISVVVVELKFVYFSM